MVVAWAHQDCSKPLDQSEQLTESKRKLSAKEEELKENEIEQVARNERLERA